MQGHMLSQRPGASATLDPSPVTGPAVNVGAYKGIMLCNRPFGGVAAATRPAGGGSGGGKPAFVSGKPPSQVGLSSTVRREPHAVVNRSKKHSALSRHKQWLHELQKTKNKLQQELEEEEERVQRRQKRFADREAKMRATVRGMAEAGSDPVARQEKAEEIVGSRGPSRGGPSPEAEAAAAASAAIAAEVRGGSAPGSDLAEGKEEGGGVPPATAPAKGVAFADDVRVADKPMWALTEDDAAKLAEQRESDEARQLLDFAANLDFESYMDDLEMRAMLERMKALVEAQSTVAGEGEEDEAAAEAKDGAAGADNAAVLAKLTAENVEKASQSGSAPKVDDDAASVARSVLSEGSVRSVHSTKSVTAIAERAKQRLRQAKLEAVAEGKPAGVAFAEPRVVVHNEEAERLTGKNKVSNLPYMHRNPAI